MTTEEIRVRYIADGHDIETTRVCDEPETYTVKNHGEPIGCIVAGTIGYGRWYWSTPEGDLQREGFRRSLAGAVYALAGAFEQSKKGASADDAT